MQSGGSGAGFRLYTGGAAEFTKERRNNME
jgi:hypothetical protein